ncbi:MAG: hypothetical protein IT174_14550 [Acidobacteria bacterium]|nr:hypothetical protein [Acidobacteriota bacterium]
MDKQKISLSEVSHLTRLFEEAGFVQMSDRYVPGENCPNELSDAQTVILTFSTGKTDKAVTYYRGCQLEGESARLLNLLNKLEVFARAQDWIN